MKKVVVFMMFMVGGLMLMSCNKEKTCKCVSTGSGMGVTADTEVTMTIKEGKCSDMNSTTTTSGIKVVTTCKEI